MDIDLHKYKCCDFSQVDTIGVLCRGESLGFIGKYKDNFKNIFVVGQHLKSFNIIGKHISKSNIVKMWGSSFNKPSDECIKNYKEYNIMDMQTYLDTTGSDRKIHKFKKIKKGHEGILKVYPIPINFVKRNKRFILKRKHRRGERLHHPTLGLFGVDLASAYKPKYVHIIGLDFYDSGYLVKEKDNVSIKKNRYRQECMIEYFRLLCREEFNIKFYLYTRCRKIKSENNLNVIKV